MNSIDIFPWDDNFNTGIAQIDEQHRRLVQLLNELATEFAFSEDTINIDPIFAELVNYTGYHFTTEEAIWQQHLPEDRSTKQHRSTHQKLIQTLNALIAERETKSLHEVAEDTLDFLVRWLAEHILESDRRMAYVVLNLQAGLSLEEAKVKANEQMGGVTRKMIDIILSIYAALARNTLQLMQELAQHRRIATELNTARSRTEQMLQESLQIDAELTHQRSFLKTLIQTLPDLIWLKDPDGVYLACNTRYEGFIGASESAILGKTDFDFLSGEQADAFRNQDQQAVNNGAPTVIVEWMHFPDGHRERVERIHTPMFDAQGRLIGVLGIGHDLTKIHAIEEYERFRSRNLELLASNAPLETILESIVLGAEQLMPQSLCSVLLADKDRKHLVQGIAPSLPTSYNNAIEGIEIAVGIGSCGTAAATGERLIAADIATHPYWRNYTGLAAEAGLGACWSEPILSSEGKVLGTFAIYHREPGEPTSEELELIEKAAGLAAIAIEHKQAADALSQAASVFQHANEGIMITDAQGTFLDVNQAFTRITGYQREEVLGKNANLLQSGKQDTKFYDAMWAALHQQGRWSGELWNRRKNGEPYAAILTISVIGDQPGQTRNYVGLFTDISAIKAHQRQLEHIAHYDVLTDLPNRVLLADRMTQAMAMVSRHNNLLAVVYLDLDGFKAVNDTYGHDIGDQLLLKLSRRMKLALREGDTLARLGGDEFVAVLLDLADQSDCIPVLERLLDATSDLIEIGETALQVSASLGVTFFPEEDGVDADQLLRQADQAMYEAKQNGRNRYHFFDTERERSVRGHRESLARIHEALNQEELRLYYQPKANMRSGEVIGAEALIRWQHPTRGLLAPVHFLPFIVNHPLAISVGEWVLETALTQMGIWRKAGLNLPVSINIDALHLQQPDFVEKLRQALGAHPDVPPGDLELEVLETSALKDIGGVSQIMHACREIGVGFSFDDFGTGYSSLTYLKRLPAAQIKVDQSFVRDMLDDPDDLAILQGILGLATAFRRDVIAEGVETLMHGDMLLRMGCERGQGYAISHPLPAHQIVDWLHHWEPPAQWLNHSPVGSADRALLFASVEHCAWVAALERKLNAPQWTPPPVFSSACRFSQWLNKEGSHYADKSALQDITIRHNAIHSKADEVLALKQAGETQQVKAGIKELRKLSKALLRALFKLT